MADKLSSKLEEIIFALEEHLWLNEKNEIGLEYAQADIKTALFHIRTKATSITQIERTDVFRKISADVDPLFRISAISQFKNVKRLNYSDYANMDYVRDVLLLYTVESSITKDAVRSCNAVCDVLSDIDKTRPNYKNSLSYKYLRIFVLLVLVSDYVSASCIAIFILTQLAE